MRNPLSYIVLFIILTAVSGCFGDKPLNTLESDARILAFGDSLTEGKGVQTQDSYPAALARLISRQVINEGISGELSEEGAQRLPDLLVSNQPDLLILMHGGNDILQNVSPATAKSNIATMIKAAQQLSVPVVLIGIPEKSLFSKTAPIYRELAEEYSVVLEDSIVSSLLKKPGMKSDSVHFNKAGYAAIAERMVEVLKDNGAL